MKIIIFYHFDSDPRFPPFLLYVRWKSGVTFVRRCFRDANPVFETFPVEQIIRGFFLVITNSSPYNHILLISIRVASPRRL